MSDKKRWVRLAIGPGRDPLYFNQDEIIRVDVSSHDKLKLTLHFRDTSELVIANPEDVKAVIEALELEGVPAGKRLDRPGRLAVMTSRPRPITWTSGGDDRSEGNVGALNTK